MTKFIFRTAGTCLALSGLVWSMAAPANAQSTGVIPVRAKIGILQRTGDAKALAGGTAFNIEADVAIPNLGQGKYLVSAGYSQSSGNGGKLRMIPVTIGRYFSPPNPLQSATGNVYFGAGLGPYFVRASNGARSENKTTVGGYGVVGYQFPKQFFVEAKYHIVGSVAGVNPGGLALMVGTRF